MCQNFPAETSPNCSNTIANDSYLKLVWIVCELFFGRQFPQFAFMYYSLFVQWFALKLADIAPVHLNK
jgi:hypothetical protein